MHPTSGLIRFADTYSLQITIGTSRICKMKSMKKKRLSPERRIRPLGMH